MQAALRAQGMDGWLFYDHHHRDPIAYRILGLSSDAMVTRRWYYWVPAQGEPRKLVHRIEAGHLDALPGDKQGYASWEQQHALLRQMLAGARRIAMQYSPENAIPTVSLVDAGTVELLRGFGLEVVSSADLVSMFEAVWPEGMMATHKAAGKVIDQAISAAWQEIRRAVDRGLPMSECDLQHFLIERLEGGGLLLEGLPIVAINGHAGDPHYEPTPERAARFQSGDLVLLDVWGKQRQPDAGFYDVTWVGYVVGAGQTIPAEIEKVFGVVVAARDAAIAFVQKGVAEGRELRGFEVDRVARGVIEQAGYGEAFVHRTGHSLGASLHANGANLDSLETRDERRLLPHTAFSVEPGIYLERFGIRSEVNMYLHERSAEVTGPIQREIVRI